MGVGEPLGAGVIEVCEGALAEFLCRFLVSGDGTGRIAGGGLLQPFDPFGRVKPAVAQFDEAAGGFGDGDGARVFGVVGGGNVRREALREEEGLEGRGRRVARVVADAEPCAEPQRPYLVEAAVQDAERRVIVAGDDDKLVIGGRPLRPATRTGDAWPVSALRYSGPCRRRPATLPGAAAYVATNYS